MKKIFLFLNVILSMIDKAFCNVIYVPGMLGSDWRNKIGDIVGSKNRAASFFRKWVRPFNPKSDKQLAQRAVVTYLSQNWKALDDADRLAWNAFAESRTFHNQLGQPYKLSGEQVYIELNCNLEAIGVAYIDTPPVDATYGIPIGNLTLTCTNATSTIALAFTTPIALSDKVLIYATGGVSQGIYYPKNFRLIGVKDSAFLTGGNLFSLWTTVYGSMAAVA